ncbi:MAG: hypothetical protein ACFFB5_23170 [Promethearchaeota archaeon]
MRSLKLYICTFILAFISGTLIVASLPSMIDFGLTMLGMEWISPTPNGDMFMVAVFVAGILGLLFSFGMFVFLYQYSPDPNRFSSKSLENSSIRTSYLKPVGKFFSGDDFSRANTEFNIGNYRSAINRLTRLQQSGPLTPERKLDVKLLLAKCHFQLKEYTELQCLLEEVFPNTEETPRFSLQDIQGAQSLLELFRLPLSVGTDTAIKQNELIDTALHLDLAHPEVTKWNNWLIKQTALYMNLELKYDSYHLMLRDYEEFLDKHKDLNS